MKYLAMVVLKPNIKKGKIDFVQGGIISLFEQKSKLKRTYFLDKRKLDYPIKDYTEGYYLKIEFETKEKKISQISDILKLNDNVIFHFIINNESERKALPILKKVKNPFNFSPHTNYNEPNISSQKIYMLISKNMKLPFSESNILAISNDLNKLFQVANKKLQEYIYCKGFHTVKEINNMKDIENELKKYWKVQFTLGDNINVGQELLIQEKSMI